MDENAKCRHQWLIEFAKMPDSVEKFAAILDATLKEVNSDYEAKRWKDIALQPLEVIVAREGLFHDWLAQRGKLGGQHKVPRLSNTREYIETMLALNDSILFGRITKNQDITDTSFLFITEITCTRRAFRSTSPISSRHGLCELHG